MLRASEASVVAVDQGQDNVREANLTRVISRGYAGRRVGERGYASTRVEADAGEADARVYVREQPMRAQLRA